MRIKKIEIESIKLEITATGPEFLFEPVEGKPRRYVLSQENQRYLRDGLLAICPLEPVTEPQPEDPQPEGAPA